jgi:hypothetical protein
VTLAPFAAPEASNRQGDSLACPPAGQGAVEQFLAEALGQWETLWQQLDERQQALVSERQRMNRDFRERAEELDRQRAGVAAQREQIREEIRRAVAAAATDMADALNRQRQQTADERTQWHDELARTQKLLERIAQQQTNP